MAQAAFSSSLIGWPLKFGYGVADCPPAVVGITIAYRLRASHFRGGVVLGPLSVSSN
jgi:hypothetical protein